MSGVIHCLVHSISTGHPLLLYLLGSGARCGSWPDHPATIESRARCVPDDLAAPPGCSAVAGNLDAFRADQDATAEHEDGDPYDQ
jgi:hypothetical protein